MARKRMIDPNYWSDDKVIELEPTQRLLFIGMWNFADDSGVLKYSPKQIKAQIFPADSINPLEIDKWLLKLYDLGLILLNEDKTLIQIKGWQNYQKINRPQPSKYDFIEFNHKQEPTQVYRTREDFFADNPMSKDELELEKTLKDTEKNNDDSRNVHGIITPNRKEKKGIEDNRKENNIKVKKKSSNQTNESFEQFYINYPRKVQKQRAVKAWKRLNKTEQNLAITSLPKHLKQWDNLGTEIQHIPHPASWINAKSWEDEITDIPITNKYKLDDYKLDSTGNARIGYCFKCNSSDFYKYPNTEDSRCCNDKLLPISNNTKRLTDELRKKQSSLGSIKDINQIVNKYK